ncbi:MAG: ABC transporter permease subunit [Dehalococcoidia bacterium]|nr:ABC transporter permease subunit [Dehalococcoidia bacterium]
MGALIRHTLLDLRWQVFWYGVGLGAYAAAIVFVYPQFSETLDAANYPDEFLQFFGSEGDLSTPANFLGVEYFSWAPLVFLVFAVFASTGVLAGEEGRGTLETLLAQPVSRGRLFLSKATAVALAALAITAIVSLGWAVSVPLVDLRGEVGVLDAVRAQFLTLPLVLFFCAWGLFLAAIAPARGQAAALLGVVVIVSYLVSSLAGVIEPIEWMKYLSPYYYAGTSTLLTTGPVWWHQALLLGAAVIGGGLALRAFQGREIGAGRWQFRALIAGGGVRGTATPRRPARAEG